MHIGYLKIFADLGRYHSFSRTAQANNISQAAVSKVVGRLEGHLGVLLVDRSIRPLQLTEQGKTFWEGCRSLVERYNRLEAAIGVSRARKPSKIQIAAIYSVGLSDMSRHVELFRRQSPDVEVQIEYLHPASVYERVLEGIADFGLVSYPRRASNLAVVPWREEEMLLACSPGHELARHHSIKLVQLNGQRYIGFTRELPIRRKVDRFLRQHKVDVEVILEFDNIEYVKKALEIGSGVALLPEPMLKREVESGTLAAIPLADCRFVRPLSIIYRRNPGLSPAASCFIRLIRQSEDSQSGADRARKRRTRASPPVAGSALHVSGSQTSTIDEGRRGAP
ncbi:MAG TPA: LysR family transcriptional regulator [Acidobacteriota bacterium]|nr:LysR family transcriptional regulator [Acidobacteriota bacterium]